MTQPPNAGAQPPGGQPPEDPTQPIQPAPPYGQPPHAAPGQPFPGQGYPGQPTSAQPFPGQPFPGQPFPGQPFPGQPFPGQPFPGQPFPGQPASAQSMPGQPPFPPPPGHPGYAQPAPQRRGLLIASVVLAVVLVLCGGGGLTAFLMLRDTETGEGAAEPVVAVDGFLKAVYTDNDATKAAGLICSEARDKTEITKKVEEVKKYATTYDKPRFRWETPKIDDQNAERAIVSTKVTMMTGDEKVAEQQLKFIVVQKTGWWVCEVS